MGHDSIICVTGASGQVGRALKGRLPSGRFFSHADLDVTDVSEVPSAISGADVVIHLAAMTNVDRCEQEPGRCIAVNTEATRILVEAAAQQSTRLVFLSTDYVFDGKSSEPYSEGDETNPLNVYGHSKLAGEGHVARHPNNLIVRTSWVFGNGRNFIRSILSAARGGKPLVVVDDQRGRPTSADDLAAALMHLVHTDVTGVVHVSGAGAPCTWADLAVEALVAAGITRDVEQVDTSTYTKRIGKTLAKRPENSVLSLNRAEALGVPLRDWREALREYVEEVP